MFSHKLRWIAALIFVFLVCAYMEFSHFDREYMLSEAFGCNLEILASGKPSRYTDGCFVVSDVNTDHPLYKRFFSSGKVSLSTDVTIESRHDSFAATKTNPVEYLKLGKSGKDYIPVVAYYPEKAESFLFMPHHYCKSDVIFSNKISSFAVAIEFTWPAN